MTDATPFTLLPLGREPRNGFDCGQEELNRYFHTQISQDVRRKVTSAFLAKESATGTIAGFYTLAACHLNLREIEADWRQKLPHYPTVPAALIGRLAVDRRFQRQGLGAGLLADAAMKALRSDVGVHLLVADAKDETAAAFYLQHGMRRSPVEHRRLFVPVATLVAHLMKD